jgi:hypothetical protein
LIPERFSVDVCDRLLQLLDLLEPIAEHEDIRTTFLLMAAMPLLVIPLERTGTTPKGAAKTDVSDADRDPYFSTALGKELAQPFAQLMLGEAKDLQRWRSSVLDKPERLDNPASWTDVLGRHPLSDGAVNDILDLTAREVWQVLRNALAHANVVYLDERGYEDPSRRVTHLGFVSRLDRKAPSYRVIIVEENAFSSFLRAVAALIRDTGLGTTLATRKAA